MAEKTYTQKEVRELLKKTFPDSPVDFEPELITPDVYTESEVRQIIENFPKIEAQFRTKAYE